MIWIEPVVSPWKDSAPFCRSYGFYWNVRAKRHASGFEGLITYIHGLLPVNEVIEKALCKTVAVFQEFAVRELVANAFTLSKIL